MSPEVSHWVNEWDVTPRHRFFFWRELTAPQLFAGSFLLLIILGTLGLRLLPGLYVDEGLSWLDAIFTATSAVCVTGLIVVDTATYFTTTGQAFLLLLIQLGGLGMITLTTLIILVLGRRLSLRQEVLSRADSDVSSRIDVRRLARDVVRFTLAFELVGALLLWLLWFRRLGPLEAIWHAVFHSVSAFCNAGFSTFSDSLVGYTGAPFTLLLIMLLVVAGGIGFLTMEELQIKRRMRRLKKPFRLSVHSRLVLSVTGVLVVGGWVLFTLFEWSGALAHLPVWARPINSLFMSVTARTAGFNTIDYAAASDHSNFLTVLLMSIGGSPGSTAGGMKTTTIALIGLMAWSRFRGRTQVSVAARTIPDETVQRAVGLFVAAFGVLTAAIFLLTATEASVALPTGGDRHFLAEMFEATSAFNTVGLTMGVTPGLSAFGKSVTVLLMFVGRVGPLVFAAAVAMRRTPASQVFRYAYEDVVVG